MFLDPAWPDRTSSFFGRRPFSFFAGEASSIQPNELSLFRGAGADSAAGSSRASSFCAVPRRRNWGPSVFFDPAGPDRTSSFFGGRASSFPRAGADCASSAATFLFSAVPKRRSWGPSVVPTGGTCVNSSHGGAEHGSIRALGRLNRSPSVFLDPAWPCRSSSFSEGRAFSFSLRRASSIQPNGLSLSRGAGADSARSPRAFSFSGVPKRRSWGPSVVPTR